jgi:hypothetical protein
MFDSAAAALQLATWERPEDTLCVWLARESHVAQ